MKYKSRKTIEWKFDNLIKQAKYNLVLPREGIRPLNIIIQKQQNLFQLWTKRTPEGEFANGTVKDIFKRKGRGPTLPKVKTNALPQTLQGSDILDGKSKFVLDVLAKNGITSKVSAMEKVLFSFENAQQLVVNQIQVDEYINYADVDQRTDYYDKLKNGEVYIVTDVLQSQTLKLTNANDFQAQGKITTNEVLEYISKLKMDASFHSKENYAIKNDTNVPLTFAFKAVKIHFSDNKYRLTASKIIVRGTELKGAEGIEADFVALT